MSLQKIYKLTVETNTNKKEVLIIKNGLSINFDITRSSDSNINTMQLSIFNLSLQKRNILFQDIFNINIYRRIILEVGYRYSTLSRIFQGNILEAFSEKSGTDIITRINCRDGGFGTYTSITNKTFGEGILLSSVIQELVKDIRKITKGKIIVANEVFERGISLIGNPYDLIMDLVGKANVFIDLETINIIGRGQTINGFIPKITSENNILNTPIRKGAMIILTIIFEPRIIAGQIIKLKSSVNPLYNGTYKIVGIQHTATISPTVSGDSRTTLSLFAGDGIITNV